MTSSLQPASGTALPGEEDAAVHRAALPPRASSAEAAARGAASVVASGDGAEAKPAPGTVSPTCINGWSSPPMGSALRKAALDMMRTSEDERFVVIDIRYFVGPEDAEVIGPRHQVERWYVKGYVASDPKRRQRWLVRRAPIGRGVDAVAPYDSRGYGPGIWRRLDSTDESLADPFERPCNVAAPSEKCMGLPREVLGCLEGT